MFGDVTSANVVGYNTLDEKIPMVMVGISFSDLTSTDGVRIGDIKGDFVQNDRFMAVSSYYDDEEEDTMLDFTTYTYRNGKSGWGWYNKSNSLANDVRIKQGTALYFSSQNMENPEDITALTVAGQVDKLAYTHPTFTEPYMMVCSAFPTGFNPNDLTRVEFTGLAQNDRIMVESSYYDDEEEDSILEFTTYTYRNGKSGWCWYDKTNNAVSKSIVNPGQGFYLSLDPDDGERDYSEVTLKEYSPLAPKVL